MGSTGGFRHDPEGEIGERGSPSGQPAAALSTGAQRNVDEPLQRRIQMSPTACRLQRGAQLEEHLILGHHDGIEAERHVHHVVRRGTTNDQARAFWEAAERPVGGSNRPGAVELHAVACLEQDARVIRQAVGQFRPCVGVHATGAR